MKRTHLNSRPVFFGKPRVGLAKTLFCSILLLMASDASAAGIVCQAAQSRSEQAVCADDSLRQLDHTLAETYAQLRRALPKQEAKLRQEQADWLKIRDQCADARNCLNSRYSERIDALNGQRRAAVSTRPDQTDQRALHALRAAVEARLKSDPEFPLEKTLESMRIRQGMTDFSNVASGEEGDDQSRFPSRRPPGVSADEWRALRKSQIDGGGENGMGSYFLVDLDGDGRRDLVVDSYVGGTGLFNYISVLRRQGDHFSGTHAGDAPLYSINGRGSNQRADWILLAGRVYVAYRNSTYGQDDLYLLRPFGQPGEVPILTLHYGYDWSVPKEQPNEAQERVVLDAPTHAALVEAMARFVREETHNPRAEDEPLCPVPPGADPSSYSGYGAGHYSYETLADVPVWIGQECQLGQVVDWFGGYNAETGLFAPLWTRGPETGEQRAFEIRARRRVSRMESRTGPAPGDM